MILISCNMIILLHENVLYDAQTIITVTTYLILQYSVMFMQQPYFQFKFKFLL